MKFNILNNLRLWQKLGILLAIALLMTAFPFYQFYTTQQGKIDFANREATGVEPARALIRITQRLADHRGLSTSALNGNANSVAARPAKEAELNKLFTDADAAIEAFGFPSVKTDWAKFRLAWNKTVGDAKNTATVPLANFDAHTALIFQGFDLIQLVADEAYLTFDPDAHTYYLYLANILALAKEYEYMGQARGLGATMLAGVAGKKAAAEANKIDVNKIEWTEASDRARLQSTIDFIAVFSKESATSYAKAFAAMPRLSDVFSAPLKASQAAQANLPKLSVAEIIKKPQPTFDSSEYFRIYSAGMADIAKLNELGLDTLKAELAVISAGHRATQLQISFLVLFFVLIGIAAAFLISRNITSTVSKLQNSVDKVRAGDLQALSAVESKDEVGDLGRTVNTLLQERIAAQQKAEDENDKLNTSVIALLTTVAELSQRNLTVKAPVTEDVIGTVADSINQLTDATSGVLRDVTKIAGVVEHASKRVKQQSDTVNTAAESERASVARLMDTLKASTSAMNQVSALAQTSNTAAAEASRSTESAMTTVDSTVRGMDAIRETISEMEKRIKRLGERSQEISQIVGLINTISERTHVLSLNASMQAAMAGDAGRGFAVVAEEVQRLAENSRQATAQIANLVQNIQIETNDTIATVNKTIDQVVQGSDMARSSGEKMRETRASTQRLVEMVQTIATSTLAQVSLAADLQTAANEITLSTEKTAEQLSQQNQVTTSLVTASQKLVESVSVFKLPAVQA
jgi:twitching motility protein PilJ